MWARLTAAVQERRAAEVEPKCNLESKVTRMSGSTFSVSFFQFPILIY